MNTFYDVIQGAARLGVVATAEHRCSLEEYHNKSDVRGHFTALLSNSVFDQDVEENKLKILPILGYYCNKVIIGQNYRGGFTEHVFFSLALHLPLLPPLSRRRLVFMHGLRGLGM